MRLQFLGSHSVRSQRFCRSALALISLSLVGALVGCNSAPTTIEPVPDTSSEQASESSIESGKEGIEDAEADSESKVAAKPDAVDTKDRPKRIGPAIAPGKYCYQFKDDIKEVDARLTVDASDRVTGHVQGVIQDEAQGYYTSYRKKLDGTIDGSNLNLDIETWIELDKQNDQQTWKVSDNQLSTERDTLKLESCETVDPAFQVDGIDAKDLTQYAEYVRTREVFFDAGKSGTTVSDSVVRAHRDVYTLTAQAGQEMQLDISSVENNAVFDVISPSDMILTKEAVSERLYLPEKGEYQIVVGGTRGNATYELDIEIE